MTIIKKVNGDELVLVLAGRLDTSTASQLEAELKVSIDNIKTLILDLKDIEYVSSAGLRVILSAQKVMSKQGKMIIRNINESVMEVFEITGFADILTIE
jgi:anti-anti-sigma factor